MQPDTRTGTDELAAPWAHRAEAVVRALGTDPQRGLSTADAAARLDAAGPNVVEGRGRRTRRRILLDQFTDVLVWLLVVAAAISGLALGEWVEALVITAIVVLNAALGYVQQARAEDALAALRALAAPVAHVLRDGEAMTRPAAEVVPGDVVILEAGDRVPADGRLVEAASLLVNEATLTGESFPAAKGTDPVAVDAPLGDRAAMVLMGTAVERGRGRAVVTATGRATSMGEIAALLADGDDATPLQRELRRLGRRLGAICVAVAGLVFFAGIARGWSAESIFLVAVALAVAAIPEGLPAVVTITLAGGVQRMARRAAIVRRLPAVETLGAVDVICTDKTGTLTRNRIRVRDVVFADATLRHDVADPGDARATMARRVAALCSNARRGARGWIGDPTEVALLVAVEEAGDDVEALRRAFPRLAEAPFDADRKRMSTVHDEDGGVLLATKGAPELVLDRCAALLRADGAAVPATAAALAPLRSEIARLARLGLRTLALAHRRLERCPAPDAVAELEHDLVLDAVVAMSDELRPEAATAVAAAQRAGIRVVLVTGDHADTAATVARETGIVDGGEVLGGDELRAATEAELADRVPRIAVFARVEPRDKVKIVRAWQARGARVAMTGDGVNDAPALRHADIGVAMGSGTDVAKDAADIVLTDDNFATIVAAVEEGRRIADNIRKVVTFLIAANLSEILVIAIGVLAFGGLGEPLLATQILWINLVTDGLPVIALGVDAAAPGIMDRRPDTSAYLDRRNLATLAVVGALLAGCALVAVGWGEWVRDLEWPATRTLLFTALVGVQLAFALDVRAGNAGRARDAISNRALAAAVAGAAACQVVVVQTPVGTHLFGTHALAALDWLVLAALPAAAFVALRLRRRVDRQASRPASERPAV